jgi:hypothetical protein
MWDFGGGPARNSGFRIELAYIPNFIYDDTYNNIYYPSHKYTKQFNNDFVFNLSWEKPIKQKLQSAMSFSAGYFVDHSYSYFDLNSNGISGTFNYSFGIYPNTRTSFKIGLNLSGNKAWRTLKKYDGVNDRSYETSELNTYPSFSLDYYFSPKLKLNCYYYTTAYFAKNFDSNGKDRQSIANYLNISLTYSIF